MTQNSDLSLRILASLLRFSSYLRTQVFSRLVSEETNCKFRFQWEYLCFVLHLFTYIICWKEIYLQLQTFTSAADDLFFMRTETTEEHDNMKNYNDRNRQGSQNILRWYFDLSHCTFSKILDSFRNTHSLIQKSRIYSEFFSSYFYSFDQCFDPNNRGDYTNTKTCRKLKF